MNIFEFIQNYFPATDVKSILIGFGIFLLFILLSLLLGQYTPFFVRLLIKQILPQQIRENYESLFGPIKPLLKITATLILVSLSLNWIWVYGPVYNFISSLIDLAVIISVAWLASRLFRQFIQVYGINLATKFGREVDELLVVFEAFANVIIGFFAVLAFAKNRFDLVGLVTSLGIAGVAVAFAAQKTLEQLLSTIILYLDQPFVSGEYIRLQRSERRPEGLFGRVESIGLRSTKIRAAAKSTLVIIPNSILANLEIENVTRGKKIMVLLYIDFLKFLDEREQALVQQAIAESTDSLFGIDPGSTSIALTNNSEKQTTYARVTFFILGSSENSIQLRKRLLELANEKTSKKLLQYGIDFIMQEPNIYVESPITL